ncbi:MAG: PPOX class F420-dependent oxidoreductase [Chloroflexi bacterium]|nr:MAG: PPOX class F420-dependent oxidoreductase [Chloroflexota bacterium]
MTDAPQEELNVIPENYVDLLESTALAHVATIGPRGEQQTSPVWFGLDGRYVRFSQTKTRQKFKNVQREPRIALSIVDPQNPYRYIEIRGRVVQIEDGPELQFINSMAQKYMDEPVYPWHQPGDERVVVVIEPEHTTQMG